MIYSQSNWPVYRTWDCWPKFHLRSPNFNYSIFVSRRDACLSNAIILFETRKLWVSFCVCSHGSMSIQILSEIGTLVGEDDEEEDDVGFDFAFGKILSALVREYSTILDSSLVLAEESSFSHGLRAFSDRSLTNLSSPSEILIHDWDLIQDKDVSCLQILVRGMTNDPKRTSLHR